jgi:hypothetical protein
MSSGLLTGMTSISSSRAWVLCALLFFATALSFLDRQVLSVLAPQITAEFGMADKAQDAYALVPRLKAADLDLVFCDMLTYATAATFGTVTRNSEVPIVLVALPLLPGLEYARAVPARKLLLHVDHTSWPGLESPGLLTSARGAVYWPNGGVSFSIPDYTWKGIL